MSNHDSFDATQRVTLDQSGRPSRVQPQKGQARPPRPTPAQRKAQQKRRRQLITLISLSVAAVVLLIIILFLLLSMFGGGDTDDNRILSNVYAAGVNLGGLTKDEAKAALKAQTDNTYSQLDMTVSVLDHTITLSPEDTGAALDVDAVVEAAYSYGRTGSKSEQQRIRDQAQSTSHTVSVLQYLNLDLDYIETAINDLGERYSTILKQSTYTITGTRPDLQQDEYDTETVYQVLTINLGTAEYGLSIETLYQQVLDAYDINLFQVTAKCTMVAPDELNWEGIFNAYCVAPVNADFNVDTYEVIEEIYGYGFTMEDLNAALDAAEYGDVIRIELKFIEPDILSEFYSKELFQDTLATFSTPLSSGSNWKSNAELACKLLNGTIVKMEETFSFNEIIGEPTEDDGFLFAAKYLGMSYQNVLGGGICQVASTLYYSALASDLQVTERTGHSYAVDYIPVGFDAEIYYGTFDLKFVNTSGNAIRIDAAVRNNQVVITIMGTDTRDYTVQVKTEIDQVLKPETVFNTLPENNSGGYLAGDILRPGITGYKVSTYILKFAKPPVEEEGDGELGEGETETVPPTEPTKPSDPTDGGEEEEIITDENGNPLIEQVLVGTSYYAKQDQVIVDIYYPPVIEPDPSDPSDSTDPSDPSDSTDPSGPSQPSDSGDTNEA